MATRMGGPDSNLTVSDLFPIQQSPSYYENQLSAFRNQNIHETALAAVGSTNPNVASSAEGAGDPWTHGGAATYGMLHHHVEMLVVIMKDDVAWRHLQRSTQSCSPMHIRHRLDDVLKGSFQVAVERRDKERRRFLHGGEAIESYGGGQVHKAGPATLLSADDDGSDGAGTLATESSSSYADDDCGDITVWDHDPFLRDGEEESEEEHEDGEFLMGGRTGQGMLLEPISYKDIDLMRHPRCQILGDSQGVSGTVTDRRPHNHELPAVFLSPRRTSLSQQLCRSRSSMLGAASCRAPLVERV